MKNRKLTKMIPLVALGFCAFGLAACASQDVADYAPPVLAAPTRKAAFNLEDDEAYIKLVFDTTTFYDIDGETFDVSDLNAVVDSDLPIDFDYSGYYEDTNYIELYADLDGYDLKLLPSTFNGSLSISITGSSSVLYLSFENVTWSDWYNEYFYMAYNEDDSFYTYVYSYTSINSPDNVVGGIVEILTGGITGLGEGIASGVNTFINSLAFSNGALSPFFVLTVVFGGIALAVGLTRLVFNWVSDLGGSK